MTQKILIVIDSCVTVLRFASPKVPPPCTPKASTP
jgi:hypothetical protein